MCKFVRNEGKGREMNGRRLEYDGIRVEGMGKRGGREGRTVRDCRVEFRE